MEDIFDKVECDIFDRVAPTMGQVPNIEPPPFDFDKSLDEGWLQSQPIELAGTHRKNIAESLEPITRPFLSQGYIAASALNRGLAYFSTHLDLMAKFAEKHGLGKSEGLFKQCSETYDANSKYWMDRANQVGYNFIDELVGEATGGAVPGIAEFMLNVPYAAATGMVEAEQKGQNPIVGAIVSAAKRGVLGAIFKAVDPLKQYLRAPIMGTVFATQTAAEGGDIREVGKSLGTGALYSLTTPGGQLGLRDFAIRTQRNISLAERSMAAKAGEKVEAREVTIEDVPPTAQHFELMPKEYPKIDKVAVKDGEKIYTNHAYAEIVVNNNLNPETVVPGFITKDGKFVEQYPKNISPEAEGLRAWEETHPTIADLGKEVQTGELKDRERQFLKTAETSEWVHPKVREILSDIQKEETQIYYQQTNAESVAKANKRIDVDLNETVNYVLSETPMTAEKGATFIALIDKFQREGNLAKTVEMIEAYDVQAREAGRFIQTAAMLTKVGPGGFLKWAEKQVATARSKYNFIDEWLGRDKGEFTMDEKMAILKKQAEIMSMPDGPRKVNAQLELVDQVAQKVPPGVSEMIDAFRYQNMLSGFVTQMRNTTENMFNTWITRPMDLAGKGTIDWIGASLFGKQREAYVKDVALYYKEAWNAVPNAVTSFMEAWRMEVPLNKPDIGITQKTAIERARAKQLPGALTIVPRFMEAMDKFNVALISAGEYAVQIKNGVPEVTAREASEKLAHKYLYRAELKPGDKSLSYMSQALAELGNVVYGTRKMPVVGPMTSWAIPFVITPINKGIQMIELSPLGVFRSTWDKEYMGRLMGASAVTALGAVFTMMGETTWSVPTDPESKKWFFATGRKPFSLRIGNTWIPFWYLGPYALSFGFPAAIKHYTVDRKEAMIDYWLEKVGATATGLMKFIASQSSVQSIGNFFAWISGDIDFDFMNQLAFMSEQIIPAGGFLRMITQLVDPVYRRAHGFGESIMRDMPFLSKELPSHKGPLLDEQERDWWNSVVPYAFGGAKEPYESIYPSRTLEEREKFLSNKISFIQSQLAKGEKTTDQAVREIIEITAAYPKITER